VPDLAFRNVSPVIDTSINAAATVVAAIVALLAWIRYREMNDPAELFKSAAFLALAIAGLIVVVVEAAGRDVDLGFTAARPGYAPLYCWTLQGITAAVLLYAGSMIGSAPPDWAARIRSRSPVVILVPTIVLTGCVIIVLYANRQLMPLLNPETIDRLAGSSSMTLFGGTPLFDAIQLLIGAGFLAASLGFARRYRAQPDAPTGALAIGLLVAAFGQVHFVIAPVEYTSSVTSADILRVAFYSILLLGVAAAVRNDLRALRLANTHLERLREADIADAASAERTRLAREIHDGLVQDLWLARLRHGELEAQLTDPQLRDSAEQVDRALENALAEARQAVVVLAARRTAASGFQYLIETYVRDYAARIGLSVDVRQSGPEVPLDSATEAEILRIFREALVNVSKHADATTVVMSVDADDQQIAFVLADNGVGFTPSAVDHGFGITSMRERAAAIGGTLEIDSRPMDGTRVKVTLPLPAVTR